MKIDSLWRAHSEILKKPFDVSFGDIEIVIYELLSKDHADSVESLALSVTRGTVTGAIFRNQNTNGGGLQAIWADDLVSIVPEKMELIEPGELIINSEHHYKIETSNGSIVFKRENDNIDDSDLDSIGDLQVFSFLSTSPETITLDANYSRSVLSLDSNMDEPDDDSDWEVIRSSSACQDDAEELITDSKPRVAYDRFVNWLGSMLKIHNKSSKSYIDMSIEKFNLL